MSQGVALEDVGSALELQSLFSLVPPRVEIAPGRISCEVTNIDRFGNVRLSVKTNALSAASLTGHSLIVSSPGGNAHVRRTKTYQDLAADEIGLIEDSFGWLCLVMNRASAALRLGAGSGSAVEIS